MKHEMISTLNLVGMAFACIGILFAFNSMLILAGCCYGITVICYIPCITYLIKNR